MAWGNVLLAGDAAALATNWMCMGIEPALRSGQAAAGVILKALKKEDEASSILAEYPMAWEDQYGPVYRRMASFAPAFWSFNDSMWEFILKYDLRKLKPRQFMERMKYNDHRMKWGAFNRRYLFFRFGKMFSALRRKEA